jgi:hypothetical protein
MRAEVDRSRCERVAKTRMTPSFGLHTLRGHSSWMYVRGEPNPPNSPRPRASPLALSDF